MTLRDRILSALAANTEDYGGSGHSHGKVVVQAFSDPRDKGKSGFEIEYSGMYSAPELNFTHLKALSELFGTDKIDVNHFAYSGCDTCDYGSSYGNTIQVYEPQRYADEAPSLFGKDLFETDEGQ